MIFNIFMDDEREPEVILGNEGKSWLVVRDIETMCRYLTKGLVNHASLDHDMGGKKDSDGREMNGEWLVKWMRDTNNWPKGNITVHSNNPGGKAIMISIIKDREKYQEMYKEMKEKKERLFKK